MEIMESGCFWDAVFFVGPPSLRRWVCWVHSLFSLTFTRSGLIVAYLSEHRQTHRGGHLLWYYLWSVSFPSELHFPSTSQCSPALQGIPRIQDQCAGDTKTGRSHGRNMRGKKVFKRTDSVIWVGWVPASHFVEFDSSQCVGFQQHWSTRYVMLESYFAITIEERSSGQ